MFLDEYSKLKVIIEDDGDKESATVYEVLKICKI